MRISSKDAAALGILPDLGDPEEPKPRRRMTAPEIAVNSMLDQWIHDGKIKWFAYEPFRLRLADNTTYTPDFAYLTTGGQLVFVEAKGPFMRDDANVKLKVAAEMYPFRFFLYRQHKHKPAEFTAIPGRYVAK